jgi:hypothetical protein
MAAIRRRAADEARVSSIPLDAMPRVVPSLNVLRALALNHREAFVVSQMDGQTTIDVVLDLAGMPRGKALAIVERLVACGVIDLR